MCYLLFFGSFLIVHFNFKDLEPVEGPTEEITPLLSTSEPAGVQVDDVTMDKLPSNDSESNQHTDNVSYNKF